jgi:solute carrier family 25 phosphate transporter 23/24/25/41
LSDEAIQSLGTILQFLNSALFGAITQLVRSPGAAPPTPIATNAPVPLWDGSENKPQLHLPDEDNNTIDDDPYIPLKPARRKSEEQLDLASDGQQLQQAKGKKETKLMDFVPHVGYFLAGGVSGITSRTATAPLDRLKVYLIAQTGTADDAVIAAKKGNALAATKHGARTLWFACKDLWAAGGVRSLFAGESEFMRQQEYQLI